MIRKDEFTMERHVLNKHTGTRTARKTGAHSQTFTGKNSLVVLCFVVGCLKDGFVELLLVVCDPLFGCECIITKSIEVSSIQIDRTKNHWLACVNSCAVEIKQNHVPAQLQDFTRMRRKALIVLNFVPKELCRLNQSLVKRSFGICCNRPDCNARICENAFCAFVSTAISVSYLEYQRR